MIGLSVESNSRAVIAEIDAGLSPQQTRLALSRSLNRAGAGVRTDASGTIRKTYKIKKAAVDKAFTVRNATPSTMQVVVTVRGRPLSLASFSPKAVKGGKRRGGGATVNVKGSRKFIPGAFIQRLKSSKGDEYEVVFVREGRARFPIRALKTVDVPGLFTKADILSIINAAATERFEKALRQEIAYRLKIRDD